MKVSPIQRQDLDAVGQFLHDNLNRRFSPRQWVASLTHDWANSCPNHGMQLHDGDMLAGVFCAIYSDQLVNGKIEQFCNPHSWCVLESHRNHGIGLVLQIIRQPGYHFTMFTPNAKVAKVFLGLKFKVLDDRQYRCINFPGLTSLRKNAFAESSGEQIARRLQGQDRRDFEAHRSIPWLRFIAFGVGDAVCWVIYKPNKWKRLPAAWIMHVSDMDLFHRFSDLLRNHLLLKNGMASMIVESRWLRTAPSLSWNERRTQPKLILSKTVQDQDVRDLYSELMALDI